MLFKYVNDVEPHSDNSKLLNIGDVYSGTYTADGDRIRLDSIPGHLFYVERFEKWNEPTDEPPTTGVKFDGDKPRVDLLTAGMPNALLEISKVLTFGAKKYDDHNWKIVPDGEKRYAAALMRHFLASQSGEPVDSETGISHLAHAACCLLFMLEKELLNAKPTK